MLKVFTNKMTIEIFVNLGVEKQIKTTLDKEDSFSILDPKKYEKHKKKVFLEKLRLLYKNN